MLHLGLWTLGNVIKTCPRRRSFFNPVVTSVTDRAARIFWTCLHLLDLSNSSLVLILIALFAGDIFAPCAKMEITYITLQGK